MLKIILFQFKIILPIYRLSLKISYVHGLDYGKNHPLISQKQYFFSLAFSLAGSFSSFKTEITTGLPFLSYTHMS